MSHQPGRGWSRHLTYANVLSTLAVFLVLAGGTAWAAGLRPGSVTSKTVRNNSLAGVDLRNGGVSGADIGDGSLSGADAADGSIGAADFAKGSLEGSDFGDGSLSGADLAKGAVGGTNLATDAVGSTAIVDNSIQGADIGADALTGSFTSSGGKTIDESTLGRVLKAQNLSGRPVGSFISSSFYENRALRHTGTLLPDGTSVITLACNPGDVLISGGAGADNSPLVENRRQGNVWISKIDGKGVARDFEVHVICARRLN